MSSLIPYKNVQIVTPEPTGAGGAALNDNFKALADGLEDKAAASDLSAHVGDTSNPHEVTAEQVGAAPASHTHSASDINSGTLDAARIPNLSASKINAGTLDIARIPTGVTSNTVAIGSHTHSLADLSDVFTGAGALHQDLLAYAGAGVGWMPLSASELGLASATQISTAISNHAGAADPHGDRAYADSLFASLIPKGHISGLTVSNNAADPDNDLDIAAGEAVDESRLYLMRLSTPITKRLDAAWSAGSGNGGLFSGTKQPNTWYHVFLIRRDSDGALDVGFDTSVTAANKPAGWSAYRRLSSMVLTDASGNIRPFIQNGDRFEFTVPIVDLAVTGSQPTTATLLTLSTPPGLSVEVLLQLIARDTTRDGGYIRLWHGNTATVPGAGDVYSFSWTTDTGNLQVAELSGLMTSTASQIRYWSQYPNAEIGIRTRGWIDRRGRG